MHSILMATWTVPVTWVSWLISTCNTFLFYSVYVHTYVCMYRIAGIFQGQNFHGFRRLHDIHEIIVREILLVGQRLSNRCFPNFLIHMIPSNIAMKKCRQVRFGPFLKMNTFQSKGKWRSRALDLWKFHLWICLWQQSAKVLPCENFTLYGISSLFTYQCTVFVYTYSEHSLIHCNWFERNFGRLYRSSSGCLPRLRETVWEYFLHFC